MLRGGGGGLTMISTGFQLKHLLPLTITPAATEKNGVIHVLLILPSSFQLNQKYRRFRTLSPPRSNRLLLLAGVEGNPGFDMVTNWFKIEKPDGCAQPRFQTELEARLFLPGLNF
ncbi:hypothetical protein OIU76_029378 [Salix suchowensis]|nr:hypothetical protein OIU76_029378 [Salix suchowensis]